MQIFEAMQFLNSFSKLGKRVMDLSRFQTLMNRLGNPQDKLKVIHVTGTNGKGSVVRMLANMLTKAKYKTGEFTSPYIYTYNDRIKIDGINISDQELCAILESVAPALHMDNGYSQFEITTAIAFLYFYWQKCDVVVLETGLGGLFDCTNIIKNPVVTVITSVSLDHMKILGNTIEEIAKQKAGIIKPSCPVILAPYNKESVRKIIYNTASVNGSYFYVPDTQRLRVISSDIAGNQFIYKNYEYRTQMAGLHQITNALTAIETAKVLCHSEFGNLDFPHIYEGIKTALVPSRCQVIREKDPVFIVDGAHNPDGMKTLADFIKKMPQHPKILVCGMLQDKDWVSTINEITPYIDRAICVDGFTANTVFAPVLADRFKDAETASIDNAVVRALRLSGDGGMVICAGSLYLSSALLKTRAVNDYYMR